MLDLHVLIKEWAVAFAVGFAALVFVVKLFVHRRVTPIDLLGGMAELPSDISAACLSLASAYLWLKNADAKLGSLAFIVLAISFVVTTASYRFVDDIKEEILTKPKRIFTALIGSYAVLYFLSIQIISQVYAGVGQ